MSTATLSAPAARAGTGMDVLFLGLAILATAVITGLVLLDGQTASATLVIGGFGLGIAFWKAEFSFTASFRRFLNRGEAGGLIGGLIVIAVAALAVVPGAALYPNYGGAIAPLGPSLIIGAFVFGIGMQLGNGCGSGTLYTVGGGSGRMLVTLAFFVAGSVFGSLSLPPFLAMGGIDPVIASDYLGPWGGLIATLASIAIGVAVFIAIARKRGANWKPSRSYIIGGLAIGVLCVFVFAAGGHPWSVTFGYTIWGAKIATALGFDLSNAPFWQWPGPKQALTNSVLSDTSSLTDFGMIFGAMAAAAATRPFASSSWPPFKSLLSAAVGGLLMGWGARLGFGCNIGAFVGGIASGSVHGWVWFLACLPGCWIGIRLRPLFGMSKD
ncbi:YeeE/YedE family protein [Microbacteriaceae bacterium K1510]|nr:YeeE/YedE family protein [Microbacteriaceae bacterium K1510]